MSEANPVGDGGTPIRRIVVGVDGSEPSIRALQWAARQAESSGATLEVVTAWTFPEHPAPLGIVVHVPWPEELMAQARVKLDEVIGDALPNTSTLSASSRGDQRQCRPGVAGLSPRCRASCRGQWRRGDGRGPSGVGERALRPARRLPGCRGPLAVLRPRSRPHFEDQGTLCSESAAGLLRLSPLRCSDPTCTSHYQVSCPSCALVNAKHRGIASCSECENALRFRPLSWNFLHSPSSVDSSDMSPDPT